LRPAREPHGGVGGDDLAGDRDGRLRRAGDDLGTGAGGVAPLRRQRGPPVRRRRLQSHRGRARHHGLRHLRAARAGGAPAPERPARAAPGRCDVGYSGETMTHDGGYRLGVDVGGTFTDLVLKNEYPLLIERYGYLPDSGGAGRFRGGLALVRQYRFLESAGPPPLPTAP